MSDGDHEVYYGDFERDGEAAVRDRVVLGLYQNKKRALAVEWLGRLDQARRDAAQAEQAALAARAADAAERAATAAESAAVAARRANSIAEKANTTAMVAAAAAITAVIISILAFAAGRAS